MNKLSITSNHYINKTKAVRQPLFAKMSLTNLTENINSPETKNTAVRPLSAPTLTDEKKKSPPEFRVDSSPGNNNETQLPISTQSDDSPPTKMQ